VTTLVGVGLAFAGGAAGSVTRFLTARGVGRRLPDLPVGTLAVNLAGCVLIGAWAGLAEVGRLPEPYDVLLAVGFTGGFTTFSTLSYESVRLAEEGLWLWAVLNPVVSLLAGLACVGAGLRLGSGVGL